MSPTLHFTLGPVQGFVGQARRTRDLWAGSFLLSYLSGQAMKAVLDAGGRIHLPAVQDGKGETTDALLRAIMGRADENPRIGSLPNRFKASVPEDFAPKVCTDAVQHAWEKIATAVYESYVQPVTSSGHGTEAIWRRQVENFWDIAWVIGDGDGHDWLTMRKNWRTYAPPVEGGDHCTLMGDWQEISGFVRSIEREKQNAFWKAFKGERGVSSLDIGEQERLCAISLIKRLFHKKAEDAIGWKLSVNNWPSTSYLAAVEWVLDAYEEAPGACDTYLQTVEDTVRDRIFGEYRTNLQGLERVGEFGKLDGSFYSVASLENENTTPLPESDEGDRENLVKALKKLHEEVGEPPSYYALLLMDGDRLGKLLQEGGEGALSRSLSAFTEQVSGIVSDNLGVTVYAGGDDVLALLPLGRALEAAERLEQTYREAFRDAMGDAGHNATISAAVVFAGSRLTLRSVLKEAHHQLDNVAKDVNGRNSIAVSVLTGSGRSLSWRSHWYDHNDERLTTQLMKLATEQAERYSSKFLYGLREQFEVLTDGAGNLIPDLDALALITAEYMRNRDQGDLDQKRAQELAGRLLNVCRYRRGDEEPSLQGVQGTLQEDGAILVRFLASKGNL